VVHGGESIGSRITGAVVITHEFACFRFHALRRGRMAGLEEFEAVPDTRTHRTKVGRDR